MEEETKPNQTREKKKRYKVLGCAVNTFVTERQRETRANVHQWMELMLVKKNCTTKNKWVKKKTQREKRRQPLKDMRAFIHSGSEFVDLWKNNGASFEWEQSEIADDKKKLWTWG